MGRLLDFVRGDQPLSFDAMVRPHMDHLYRLAYRYTKSASDAEDLVQNVLTKLYPRVEEMRMVDSLKPWLSRVLYRMFIDETRRASRCPVRLVAHESRTDAGEPREDVFARMEGEEDQPDESLSREQLQQAMLDAMQRLNEDQRVVLMMHDMEGYTLEEIAVVCDCPVGTLKSRLFRARARLRPLLAHFHEK